MQGHSSSGATHQSASPGVSSAHGGADVRDGVIAGRRNLRRRLFAAGPIVIVAIGLFLYFSGGRYAETENAYVKANKVAVSAEVSGAIVAVAVQENQLVKQGDALFRIDDAPFRIALDRADAQLRTVQTEIEGLRANYRQVQERLRIAQTNAQFMQREVERQSSLAKQHLTPQVKLDEAQHNLDNSRQEIAVIEQQQAQILAQLAGNANIDTTRHPRYLDAKAARDNAALNLQRTVAHAPYNGIASKVPQVGQYINIGNAVMSVVANQDLWIEANFTETDLTHVRSGQPVKIRIDSYPDREWRGVVQSIAQATGAEFSVLPPQNATANWVKVAQRIPVRIAIAPQAGDPPLRMGMTAFVKIDTGGHRSLASLLHIASRAE